MYKNKVKIQDDNLSNYPQNESQEIDECISLLAFAFRLQNGFNQNLIDKNCFTKSISIIGTGINIKENVFDKKSINTQFHNLILSTLGTLSIVVDTALDKTFGIKQSDSKDNIHSLRAFFYMLRCAFSHDAIHPQWKVKEKYQKDTYIVIIPKEIMQQFYNNQNAMEKSFEFNFKNLNHKTVIIESFYGLDGLICLSLYARFLTDIK